MVPWRWFYNYYAIDIFVVIIKMQSFLLTNYTMVLQYNQIETMDLFTYRSTPKNNKA